MKTVYASEQRDNFRKPKIAGSDQLLFNYFDTEDLELWKKKVYESLKEQENS